jgi:ABC transport system ATP-binding/permease protein
VPGGKVAFFGTPADGLRHFRRDDWAEVFQDFEAEPDRDWAAVYRRSAYHARYIGVPLQAMGAAQERPAAGAAALAAPPRPAGRLAQAFTLVRRYLSVIASDRNYVGAMALLPVILGVLVRAIPDSGGLVGTDNGLAIQMLIILVMSACLTGVANGVRELVKERPIYTRERAAGLSPGAYLASKIAVLGVISAIQSVVLVAIGLSGRKMPPRGVLISDPLAEIIISVAGLAVASMTIGLLISAAVNSSDKTVPLLVGTVLVQVILCGGVIRLNSTAGLEQLAWLSPSRWGLASLGATVNLNHVVPPPPGNTPDPLWRHSVHAWAVGMALQLVLAAVFARITWALLRRPAGRLTMAGRARPALRCLREDLGQAVPPADTPLDEVLHPLLAKASERFADDSTPRNSFADMQRVASSAKIGCGVCARERSGAGAPRVRLDATRRA